MEKKNVLINSGGIAHLSWLSRAFNLSALEKARWPWVDYLKGVAIILVVYRHVLIGIEYSGVKVPQFLVTANMAFFSFRMPLFFILSGIFISASLRKRSVAELLKNKFESLFYPYLIWAFIQVSLQVLLSGNTNSNRGLQDYGYILYHPQMLDQFWYLPALFNTTAIYVLVKMKLKLPVVAQLALGLVLFFTAHYFEWVSMISDWMKFYIFFALGDAVASYFLRQKTQEMMQKGSLLLLISPFFFLAQYYYLNYPVNGVLFLIISLIGCFSMFVLAFNLQRWNTASFLRVLGYHSIYIYVMHVIVAAFVRTVLMKVLHIGNPYILLSSGIFFGVVVPVLIYNLCINGKAGWFLFSFHRKKMAA